jgi:hypothetical protein
MRSFEDEAETQAVHWQVTEFTNEIHIAMEW